MSIAIALSMFLLVPAQDAVPPADPAGDAPPPLVELAPASPPPPAATPPVAAPTPPAPDKTTAAPNGIAPVGIGAIQVGVGAGACCAGCCLSIPFAFGLGLLPVVGGVASAVASNLVVGGSIGLAETWAGDAWGQQRAALIWPVVASVGVLMSSTVLSVTASIVEPRTPPDLTNVDPNDPAALALALGTAGGGPLTTISGYYGIAACLGAVVVPAFVYAIMATDKKPGDTGGFPGFMEPANPAPAPTTSAPAADRTVAMRY